jgi:diguanylate cyclase (GGDEF)-like protein/putative nucleotidyltransferase with HDIG domain
VFGTEVRVRRPVLFLLVFGAFVALVGITATAQASIVTSNLTAVTIQSVVGGDAATIRSFADAAGDSGTLVPTDLAVGVPVDPARRAAIEAALTRFVGRDGIRHAELRRADGTLLAAVPTAPDPAAVGEVLTTQPDAAIVPLAEAGAPAIDLDSPWILREHLPITDLQGKVVGFVGLWRDGVPILARLDEVRRDVVVVTLSAALLVAVLLFFIFRSAQGRLTRQTDELVESTRRDPLTGTLNHGTLVGLLASRLEAARAFDATVGVALIDVDNFTLFNDNHGHRVGDEVLLTVLEVLQAAAPPGAVVGRYGPDEFLVIAGEDGFHELEPAIEQLRVTLQERSLDVDSPDRLPITVSAGIAGYPLDGTSLTVLLATVAATLGAAKASGGDAVRVAGAEDAATTGSSGFDVLQGLVFAVDTKDRYTKRHSEDVARYAVFLAERLGLDEATFDTIRLAGLLHDIGKIGIPDPILRKPGKLTAEEYEIVKQHVVLGDMIVRDVPDIDQVRAGIRHHHERWDGDGYVDRLAAEEIPLVARILAVGDAFSAMTTTRPYRKALDVMEAIRRLEDAAGTQLDERLVVAFVTGLESAANPPMPGDDAPARLWTPRAVA